MWQNKGNWIDSSVGGLFLGKNKASSEKGARLEFKGARLEFKGARLEF